MTTAPTHSLSDPFGIVGTTFADRFHVERVVGEGGFAVVYAARHLALDTAIALKVMKAHEVPPGSRAAFDAMFLAEARTIAKLRHPSIVQVTDCGVATLGDGTAAPWMALEWLEGQTLDADLEARRGHGGLPPAQAFALLKPALEAVAYAHEQGFAHRDLKPANLMLVPTPSGPSVRVMDFGIAKAMSGEGEQSGASGFTRTRSTSGGFSPTHAAPEQVTGMRTGPWTDVHALGLILVEVLLDRTAYDTSSDQALYGQILASTRPSPAHLGVDVGAWEPVLQQALAWGPDARFPSARPLLQALETALPGARHVGSASAPTGSSAASPPTGMGGLLAPHTTMRAGSVERAVPVPARRSGTGPALALGAGLAMLLAGGSVLWWKSRVPSTPTPARIVSSASLPSSSAQPPASRPPIEPPAIAAAVSAPTAPALAPQAPSAPSVAPPRDPQVATAVARRATAPTGEREPAARGSTGTLRVLVLPSGDVSIDGRPRGHAPVTVTVPAGRHTVRVTGAVQATREVEISAGSTQTVAVGRAGLD